MPQPKITIITPSYNQAQYLEQTLDSVLSQGYPNLEYFVFDGGSSDGSVEILKKYEKYLTYWESQPDKGQSDAINKGLVRATGEIVNWLNSDDYYEKSTLKIVGEAFTEESVNVLCCRSRIFFSENNQTSHYSSGTDVYPNNLAKAIGWARIDQPETFFRATAINKMGLLNPRLHYVMDKEWWIRYLWLFGQEKVYKSDEVLVNFRLHGESKTVSQKVGFVKESVSLYYTLAHHYQLKKYVDFLKANFEVTIVQSLTELPTKPKEEVELIMNYHIFLIFLEAYANNDYRLAKVATSLINSDLLSISERKEFIKVGSRLRYLPIYVKKAFNYFSSL